MLRCGVVKYVSKKCSVEGTEGSPPMQLCALTPMISDINVHSLGIICDIHPSLSYFFFKCHHLLHPSRLLSFSLRSYLLFLPSYSLFLSFFLPSFLPFLFLSFFLSSFLPSFLPFLLLIVFILFTTLFLINTMSPTSL